MARTHLKSRGWFNSKRIIIEEDCLGFYEQQFGSDRVRRVLFDRVESVASWRGFPWDRWAVYSIIFGLPGVVLVSLGLWSGTFSVQVVGGVLLLLWAMNFGLYYWFGRTTIAVNRDGKMRKFQTIVSPRHCKKFLRELDEAIVQYQAAHRADGIAPSLQAMTPLGSHELSGEVVDNVDPFDPPSPLPLVTPDASATSDLPA